MQTIIEVWPAHSYIRAGYSDTTVRLIFVAQALACAIQIQHNFVVQNAFPDLPIVNPSIDVHFHCTVAAGLWFPEQ